MKQLGAMIAVLWAGAAWAADEGGALNPMEMAISDALGGQSSIATCTSGYYLTKAGDHADGIKVHEKCAEAGYTRSMLWLAYIYQNGLMVPEDPAKTAYWDRRAAEAGNEVGMFNYGLDILRGYGVAYDAGKARYWIDKAAAAGHKHAAELQAAGYDPAVVTPDSDEGKFQTK